MSTEQQFKESTGLLLSPFFVEIMNELAGKKSGVTYNEMRDHVIKTVMKPVDEEYDPDFLLRSYLQELKDRHIVSQSEEKIELTEHGKSIYKRMKSIIQAVMNYYNKT